MIRDTCPDCGCDGHHLEPDKSTVVRTKLGRRKDQGTAVLRCMGYVGRTRAWQRRARAERRATMGTIEATLDRLMEEYEDAVIDQFSRPLFALTGLSGITASGPTRPVRSSTPPDRPGRSGARTRARRT